MVTRAHIAFSNTSFVSNSFFESCSCTTSGGSILFNADGKSLDITKCFFVRCYSGDRGGAVTSLNGLRTTIIKSCLIENYALAGAGFVLWSDSYNLLNCNVNFTTEIYSSSQYHGSCFGGNNVAYNTDNNHTRSKYGSNSWDFLGSCKQLCLEYSEMRNCTGNVVFAFSNNICCTFNEVNIINQKSNIFTSGGATTKLVFRNSIFFDTIFSAFKTPAEMSVTIENSYFSKRSDGSELYVSANIVLRKLREIKCRTYITISCRNRNMNRINNGYIVAAIIIIC